MLCVSLLFPARSLKTFRRFLDPHFSPTEVYKLSIRCFSQQMKQLISIRQGLGRIRLLIQPLVLDCVVSFVCVASFCIVLYHDFVLCCIIWYCVVSFWYCMVSFCTVLYRIVLCCNVLYRLYCVVLHCVVLHCSLQYKRCNTTALYCLN